MNCTPWLCMSLSVTQGSTILPPWPWSQPPHLSPFLLWTSTSVVLRPNQFPSGPRFSSLTTCPRFSVCMRWGRTVPPPPPPLHLTSPRMIFVIGPPAPTAMRMVNQEATVPNRTGRATNSPDLRPLNHSTIPVWKPSTTSLEKADATSPVMHMGNMKALMEKSQQVTVVKKMKNFPIALRTKSLPLEAPLLLLGPVCFVATATASLAWTPS